MVRQFVRFFVLLLACVPSLRAQWVQTGGPCTGTLLSSAAVDDVLLVGTSDGLYRSTDDGHSWQLEHAVLKDSVVLALTVQHRDGNPSYIFAGTGSGIFRSNDKGLTWIAVNNGLSATPHIAGLAVNPRFVFASVGGALYRSSNSGASWAEVTGASGTVLSTTDSEVFVGSSTALLRSTDDGATWTNITGALRGGVNGVVRHERMLFAGSWFGVFRSSDNGQSWTVCRLKDTGANAVLHVEMRGYSVLIACSPHSIIRSIDNGETWESWHAPSYTSLLFASSTTIFAGMSGDIAGVLRSEDEGSTWLGSSNGMANQMASTVLAVGPTLLAGLGSAGLRISTDRGGSWQMPDSGFPARSYVSALARSYDAKPSVYVATTADIYASRDTGRHWKRLTDSSKILRDIRSIAVTDSVLLFGTASHGLYYTTDEGTHWSQVVLPPSIFPGTIAALAARDSNVYLSIISGSLNWLAHAIATYGPGDWQGKDAPESVSVRNFYHDSQANDHNVVFAATPNGVLKTTNGGTQWTLMKEGLEHVDCLWMEGVAGRLFVSGYSEVNESTDGGEHWHGTGAPFRNQACFALSASDGFLYAGTRNSGVWRYSLDSALRVVRHTFANDSLHVSFADGVLDVTGTTLPISRIDIFSIAGSLVERREHAVTPSHVKLRSGFYEVVLYSDTRVIGAQGILVP